jgi:uncharacterized protein YjbI with pentapeptide repeats
VIEELRELRLSREWDVADSHEPEDERATRPGPRSRTRKDLREWALEQLADGDVEQWNHARRNDRGWRPNLRRLNLSGLDLADVDLRDANLEATRLDNAQLEGARFDNAQLAGVRFDYSNLQGARFVGANVTGASFKRAVMDYANFQAVRGLTDEQLWQAASANKVYREGGKSMVKRAGPSVFLSYAWQDKTAVMAVDQWLRDRGARVIVDERNFLAGESIRDEILRWIGEAGIIVAFISQASEDRPYPRLERELADLLRGRGEKRVIYFNLDDTVLDVLHEGRLYVPGHAIGFDEACEQLWSAILKEVRPARAVDLARFEAAGTDWTRIPDDG